MSRYLGGELPLSSGRKHTAPEQHVGRSDLHAFPRRAGTLLGLVAMLVGCTELLHEPGRPSTADLVLSFAPIPASKTASAQQSVPTVDASEHRAGASTRSIGVGHAANQSAPRSDVEHPPLAQLAAFVEVDEVRVRILRADAVARDTTVQLAPAGTTIRIELDLEDDSETLTVQVELLAGGQPAFNDDVVVSVRAGDTTEVQINPKPIPAGVQVDETRPEILTVGGSAQLSAAVLSVTGDPIEGLSVTWETLDPQIVDITADGLVTALAEGEARVVGAHGVFSDTVTFSVRSDVAEVVVEPEEVTLVAGESHQFTATLYDSEGNPLSERPVDWSSSDENVATVDQSGLVLAIAPGVTDISARSGVVSGEAKLTVTPRQRELTVEKEGNGAGTVTSDPAGISCGDDCEGSFDHGTRVVLTATAATGSTFDSWTNCPDASGSTCTVDMTAARTVIATFTVDSYTLTVRRDGTGTGTVTSEPAGISCGDDCDEAYEHGTRVVLTATAATGSAFASWTNCPGASSNTCTVDMTAARTVTATFAANSYVLTVRRDGTGTGTVTSQPAGISCGDDCDEAYEHGTRVVLTATPAAGSAFSSWTNCPAADGNTCTINMTAARTVAATFAANSYVLTVRRDGSGTGTVTSQPAGISCGDDCDEAYEHGTRVVLTAVPATGSTFASWSNCPSASGNTCTVNMTADRTVTATFTANRYILTVGRDGTGTGTVTSNPAGISCGDDCDEAYEHGTRVVLTATAAAGSAFDSWTNCPDASGNTCTVDMTADRTVTATFTANRYLLTVGRDGTGTGTVTSNPAGISCGDDCDEVYEHGTSVVLTAAPAAGSTFSSWRDCRDAVRNTCTVNMTGASTITATFARVPVGSVSIEPRQATIEDGETLSLRAKTFDRHGNELDGRTVRWASSNEQVATVDRMTGLVTASSPGQATITAASEGAEGTASISVVPVRVHSVVVWPESGSVVVGGTLRLAATVLDAGGAELSDRRVEWSSLDPNVADVSQDGLVTGLSLGEARIRATADTASGEARVEVKHMRVFGSVRHFPGGQPIVGATVEIYAQGEVAPVLLATARTGEDGLYSVEFAPAGGLRLRAFASARGYPSASSQTFPVAFERQIDFRLERALVDRQPPE